MPGFSKATFSVKEGQRAVFKNIEGLGTGEPGFESPFRLLQAVDSQATQLTPLSLENGGAVFPASKGGCENEMRHWTEGT